MSGPKTAKTPGLRIVFWSSLILLILCAGVWWLRILPPARTIQIKSMYIRGDRIYSYEWSLPKLRFFEIPHDYTDAPRRSTLILYENGRELGPAHSLHEDVATKGKGRYSHWKGILFLSASDNTAARYNGRAYSVKVRPIPKPWLLWLSLGGAGFALAGVALTLARIRAGRKRK